MRSSEGTSRSQQSKGNDSNRLHFFGFIQVNKSLGCSLRGGSVVGLANCWSCSSGSFDPDVRLLKANLS